MDLAQVTGSVSSYARKYALNGLFAIDDTKDSDTTNTHSKAGDMTNYSLKDQQPPKNQNNSVTGVSDNNGLSEKQIKRLYTLGSKAGYDANTVKNHVFTKFHKEIKLLTKAEYDAVCTGYEKMIS